MSRRIKSCCTPMAVATVSDACWAGWVGPPSIYRPLTLVLPRPLRAGEHLQSILLRPKLHAAREQRLLDFKAGLQAQPQVPLLLDQQGAAGVSMAIAAAALAPSLRPAPPSAPAEAVPSTSASRPLASSIFQQACNMAGGSRGKTLWNMRTSVQHQNFCEQALEKRPHRGLTAFFVRPGFEVEFKKRALAYITGGVYQMVVMGVFDHSALPPCPNRCC
jgi:hypothetical protein